MQPAGRIACHNDTRSGPRPRRRHCGEGCDAHGLRLGPGRQWEAPSPDKAECLGVEANHLATGRSDVHAITIGVVRARAKGERRQARRGIIVSSPLGVGTYDISNLYARRVPPECRVRLRLHLPAHGSAHAGLSRAACRAKVSAPPPPDPAVIAAR